MCVALRGSGSDYELCNVAFCAGMFRSVCTTRDDVSPMVSMASWDHLTLRARSAKSCGRLILSNYISGTFSISSRSWHMASRLSLTHRRDQFELELLTEGFA